jgi:hypothetical protein
VSPILEKEAHLELAKDFVGLLRAFAAADVRYLLVGAYAVEFHGQPRSTRHMDLWLDDDAGNLERVYRALADFGASEVAIEHLSAASPLEVVWIGVPPNRIDLSKGMASLDFASAWEHRASVDVEGVNAWIIGREDLIRAKRSTGRDKDKLDAEQLAT